MELKRTINPDETFDGEFNFMQQAIEEVARGYNKQVDDIIKIGLERKGYTFDTEAELIGFISTNCVVHDYSEEKKRIFYVNEEPFLEHNYALTFGKSLNSISVSDAGYRFL
jgi:hypothetical protein